jgi:hypothetical protein
MQPRRRKTLPESLPRTLFLLWSLLYLYFCVLLALKGQVVYTHAHSGFASSVVIATMSNWRKK